LPTRPPCRLTRTTMTAALHQSRRRTWVGFPLVDITLSIVCSGAAAISVPPPEACVLERHWTLRWEGNPFPSLRSRRNIASHGGLRYHHWPRKATPRSGWCQTTVIALGEGCFPIIPNSRRCCQELWLVRSPNFCNAHRWYDLGHPCAGGGRLRSHHFDSPAIQRYSALLTASRHRPRGPLPGSLLTGGAGVIPKR
jgi:hypothetical protein